MRHSAAATSQKAVHAARHGALKVTAPRNRQNQAPCDNPLVAVAALEHDIGVLGRELDGKRYELAVTQTKAAEAEELHAEARRRFNEFSTCLLSVNQTLRLSQADLLKVNDDLRTEIKGLKELVGRQTALLCEHALAAAPPLPGLPYLTPVPSPAQVGCGYEPGNSNYSPTGGHDIADN